MPLNFDPNTGTTITLVNAHQMVDDWVTLQGNLGIPVSQANQKAQAYGKNKILQILNQSGCEGIRIYNGLSNGNRVLIIAGVDTNGEDMINGAILETGMPCPPYCAVTNVIH